MKSGASLAIAGILLLLTTMSGCGLMQSLRGDLPTDDSSADRETKFRPPAKNSQPFFFDDKARQIERNLGV